MRRSQVRILLSVPNFSSLDVRDRSGGLTFRLVLNGFSQDRCVNRDDNGKAEMTMFDLAGKRALVTGASSGLGVSFAKVLAQAGAEVFLAARRLERLEAVADDIRAAGGVAQPVIMDVTDTQSVDTAFEQINSSGEPADIIVNNSGLSREQWLAQMDEADWDLVMDTNLKGVWRVAKAGANALMEQGKPGSIINIASITSFRPAPIIGAYATSKAAVVHLTRSMALEWARFGVRVNAIAPGYFETDINADYTKSLAGEAMIKRVPMRRLGNIDELAGPLLLLASSASSYMSGSVITVYGGHLQSAL